MMEDQVVEENPMISKGISLYPVRVLEINGLPW